MAMVSSVNAAIGQRDAAAPGRKLLQNTAFAWLAVAIVGQLIFALYVAGFYGRAAVQGRLADWTKVLSHGHVPGDFFGNAMIWLHLIFTVAIILGGIVQLIPRIRSAAPAFHRVNGRVYLIAALVLSVTGLVIMWTRGTVGDIWLHLGTSANGVVIIACAVMAWRHARAREFDLHRCWALRLFLAVSGVWFFRVGLMFWLIANQGPVGFDPKTFTGPFIGLLAFAQFLLPLALLELYFAAQRSKSARMRVGTAAVLAIATLVTAVGVGAAAMMMWLPRI
ncbi:MAG: DUF2306 domain-containing protein [Burkholderiaceae bacterium]